MLEVTWVACSLVSAVSAISLLLEFLSIEKSLPKKKRVFATLIPFSILLTPWVLFDYEKGSEKEASVIRRSSIATWFAILAVVLFLIQMLVTDTF
ncbi:MAG: hypothetical protein OIF34_00100 [Porticoccaceae bacterium]|nr:hypothetical protein [Porticoccaceae bacterium]